MNNKNYDEALKLLTPARASVYEFNNRTSMRNIKHMEIKLLEDKTNEWEPSTNIFIDDIYEYKVFYAQIHYRLNNIIESAFKDNEIYHHRIVVLKYDKDSPCLIAELSTAPWWFILNLQSDTEKGLQ